MFPENMVVSQVLAPLDFDDFDDNTPTNTHTLYSGSSTVVQQWVY